MIFTVYPLAVLCILALRGERFTLRGAVRILLGIAGVYLLALLLVVRSGLSFKTDLEQDTP